MLWSLRVSIQEPASWILNINENKWVQMSTYEDNNILSMAFKSQPAEYWTVIISVRIFSLAITKWLKNTKQVSNSIRICKKRKKCIKGVIINCIAVVDSTHRNDLLVGAERMISIWEPDGSRRQSSFVPPPSDSAYKVFLQQQQQQWQKYQQMQEPTKNQNNIIVVKQEQQKKQSNFVPPPSDAAYKVFVQRQQQHQQY